MATKKKYYYNEDNVNLTEADNVSLDSSLDDPIVEETPEVKEETPEVEPIKEVITPEPEVEPIVEKVETPKEETPVVKEETMDDIVEVIDSFQLDRMASLPIKRAYVCLVGLSNDQINTPSKIRIGDIVLSMEADPLTRAVKETTNVVFSLANYDGSSKLLNTKSKMIFTVVRCVDSVGKIFYVKSFSNMLFSTSGISKVMYKA